MVIPVVKALCVFDGKAPAMELAWKVMYDLETHVREFVQPPFALSADLTAKAISTFRHRWWMMLTDLHWAGAMLNPVLRGWAPVHEHEQSRRILNQVFRKYYPNDNTYVEVLSQYQDFLENRGPFADSIDPSVHVAPVHEWWDAMGGGAKALQTIARRIFAQVCSASACERNWSMYSFVHSNRLKHSCAEDLVYIYTNSRLLRHRRGPTPIQWYGLNLVHSDDDLNGDDQDDAEDQDPHEEGDDIDNNDVEPMDFDENALDSDDSHSDGNDDGGDEDFAIYDFNEDVMIRPSEARHVHHEGPIDGAPFEVLSTKQGVRRDHTIPTVATGTVESDVGASQPLNDSRRSSERYADDDAPHIDEPVIALHDTVPTTIHIEIANASLESNHPIQIEALHIPESRTAPTPTILESASTSELHSHPQSQHRPLTRSIASSSPLVVPRELRVGATLVATRNQLRSVGREATRHPPVASTSIPIPRGQFTGRGEVKVEAVSRRTSVRGTGTRGLGLGGGSRARDANTIYDAGTSQNKNQSIPRGNAPNESTTNQVRSNYGSMGAGQRITRGMKRRKMHQGMALRFIVEDYDESEGRPHLDENGIRDAEGSHRTKKLVVTRAENLRFRSVSPQTDDDLSTEDSE